MTAVPYPGIAAGVADVLSGRIDLLVDASTSAIPRVKAGQFRVLAVASRRTICAAAGRTHRGGDFAECEVHIVALPRGSRRHPNDLSGRFSADVKDALATPAFIKHLADLGSVPKPTSPAETRQIVAGEIARWADVIKRCGYQGRVMLG